MPAAPVDPAPLTDSPLNLGASVAALPGSAVGWVERSGFPLEQRGPKNTLHTERSSFPGSWSAGGVASESTHKSPCFPGSWSVGGVNSESTSESTQKSPGFPGSWSAGGQDLTGFGDALKSDAFRAAIGGGGGGVGGRVGGGAGGGVVRAAWMAEMWDEDVPPAFVDCITQEIMRDPVITADGHSYERAAIEKWLVHHDTSPMTGKVLPPLHSTPAATAAITTTDAATAADPLQGASFSPCLVGCSCKHSGSCMVRGRCSAVGSGEGCVESGGEGCSGHCVVDKTLRPNHILRGQIIEFQEMMALQARERTAAAAPTRTAHAFAA
ncbi:unnamed protein product [Closterium sp. Yama58-4]|nr:unnamed protein product [Closterium sp. Yama58-4]